MINRERQQHDPKISREAYQAYLKKTSHQIGASPREASKRSNKPEAYTASQGEQIDRRRGVDFYLNVGIIALVIGIIAVILIALFI